VPSRLFYSQIPSHFEPNPGIAQTESPGVLPPPNLELSTPNEKKISGNHEEQQRRGQIGLAQEVAGLEWHDGILLQEQEECG
jgi:hypothetical protein